MTKWSKEELRKIDQADDLHISPFREDGADVRYANLDLVCRDRSRPLRARLQRAETPFVPGCHEAESGADHSPPA